MHSLHTESVGSQTVRLPISGIRRILVGSSIGLAIASYTSHLIQRRRGGGSIALFDVGDEVSLGTWFETAEFMIAAIVVASLLLADVTEAHLKNRVRLLAVVMFALSVDESVSIHERMGSALRDVVSSSGYLYYIWVIPAVVAALALAVWEIPWLRSLPSSVRNRVLGSGMLFVACGGGLELLAGPDDEVNGTATMRSLTLTAIEELGEMLALAFFIVALLELQKDRRLGVRLVS